MKKITIALLCLLVYASAISQTYDECEKDFQNNKYAAAITGLGHLQDQGNKDASLLLTILEADQQHYPQAFDAFKKFYEQSENPYPYMYALIHTGVFSNYHCDAMQDFLGKVIKDPRADGAVKQIALNYLAEYSAREGDFDSERSLYKGMGDVKNWSTVGVFENISESGFNKDFGVLAHPENDHVFINKSGVPIKWFDITEVRNDRWYDFNYHYEIEHSIGYAQTFINSDEDKEVMLKIGVSGVIEGMAERFSY